MREDVYGQKRRFWWKEDDPNGTIFAAVESLDEIQSYRRNANEHYLRLYSNRALVGLSGRRYGEAQDTGERIRINITKSAIDAAVSQITSRPRPMFLPVKGNYALRQRAERLGKFITGVLYEMQSYIVGLQVFRDACIFGSGFMKVYSEDGKISGERVFPDEIVVDDTEAREGAPRQLFQVKHMTRSVLLEDPAFSKYEVEILDAPYTPRDDVDEEGIADLVTIIEAWHLPSYPGADDGRHIITLKNQVLLDEPWTRATFPFTKFDWSTPPLGYIGTGAAEELSPIQIEINYIAQKIQKLMNLATSMVWKEKGSYTQKLDNKDWAEREYTGKPPIFQTTAAVSAEFFHHLDRLEKKAYELVGISQLSAQSQKPAGLDSGEALRVYNDIGTRRFKYTALRWEQFFLDLTEQILECAREIEDSGGEDLKVLAQGDKEIEEIKFSECSIEKDKYRLRVWPTSIMPDSPAGQVELVTKLAQSLPDLQPYLAKLLTGIPDLRGVVAETTASLDLAESLVSGILEHGIYTDPYPEMDLDLGRTIGTRSLMRARVEGVDEDKIELLERFLAEIDRMQEAAQAEAMAQMQAMQGGGPGGPPPGPMAGPPPPAAGLGGPPMPPPGGMPMGALPPGGISD